MPDVCSLMDDIENPNVIEWTLVLIRTNKKAYWYYFLCHALFNPQRLVALLEGFSKEKMGPRRIELVQDRVFEMLEEIGRRMPGRQF